MLYNPPASQAVRLPVISPGYDALEQTWSMDARMTEYGGNVEEIITLGESDTRPPSCWHLRLLYFSPPKVSRLLDNETVEKVPFEKTLCG